MVFLDLACVFWNNENINQYYKIVNVIASCSFVDDNSISLLSDNEYVAFAMLCFDPQCVVADNVQTKNFVVTDNLQTDAPMMRILSQQNLKS